MTRLVVVPWVLMISLLEARANGVVAAPDCGGPEKLLAAPPKGGWSELKIDTTRDVGSSGNVNQRSSSMP